MSVNVGRLLHLCYNFDIAFVAGLRYGFSTLVLALMVSSTLVLAFQSVKSDFVAWGATNKNQRVNMRKASSRFACRQGRCRRHLRLGRAALISRGRAAGIYYFPARGTSARRNAQLPLPIASSAASACEQAFSRELLLGLTRDTVLAAVPWLRFSPKARH